MKNQILRKEVKKVKSGKLISFYTTQRQREESKERFFRLLSRIVSRNF